MTEWLPGLSDPTEIGRGGFGVVYRAIETDLNRTVAVKVLSGTLDDLALQRFDRERRAMGALSGHPNIVAIYRTGITPEDRPYLVMEYLTGGSMLERIERRGPLPWREAAEFAVRLCAALETAHRAGVLHRDVKPENVFLSSLGAPKLGDFGIARLNDAPQTQSAVITASLAHAAPEIIDGRPPSVQSDIFALASTVITLIRGRPPFSRPTDDSIVPLLARIATEPVPDMRPDGVPAPLCEVFETAMAKDPADRYTSMADFGRALQDAQLRCDAPVTPLEVQGVDPTVQPGAGAPRVADHTVSVPAPAEVPTVPVVPVPPVLPPQTQQPIQARSGPPSSSPPLAGYQASAPAKSPGSGQGYGSPSYGSSQGYATPAASANRLTLILGAVAAVVLAVLAALVLLGGEDDPGSVAAPSTTTAVTTTAVTSTPPSTDAPVTTLEPGEDAGGGLVVTAIPFPLGADADLDALAAGCAAGDLDACDDLADEAPEGTQFEQFGATCGDRDDVDDEPCDDRSL